MRFGKLGDPVDFDPNENCRVSRVVDLFRKFEFVRFVVASESLSGISLPPPIISDDRPSDTSVIIAPDVLNGCVFKFGMGGCACVPGKTVNTLIIFVVVGVLSVGKICANDGLLFRATAKKKIVQRK